ncbi:MAG: helix-hairpin-helix domain-containing protein [candidate division WOR-3 bacterium]|jgi:DNA uptake protein ComE-like DNA-binding protein
MLRSLILFLSIWTPQRQLDINQATREEIMQLPLDSITAERVFEYLQLYGRFNSIYEFLKVPGITPGKMNALKPLIYISPRPWEERLTDNIQRLQRRLAVEDGPGRAVVEEWQDLLLDPININRATVDDLLGLEDVSLVDAVAVVKFISGGGRLTSRRDLASKVDGLSGYGYRGMRNYVRFEEGMAGGAQKRNWSGNYRLKFVSAEDWQVWTDASEFAAALRQLVEDSAGFRAAGWSDEEIEFFRNRLMAEERFRQNMGSNAVVRQRLRFKLGERFRAGLYLQQNLDAFASSPLLRAVTGGDIKGYVMVDNMGPVRRIILGDYRLTVAQGLLLDNNFQLLPRVHKRTEGLFGGLSENPGFGLRGGAGELKLGRMGLLVFFSRAARDGIVNPDSSVNWYIISTPRYPGLKNVFNQTDGGARLSYDLSQLGFIPIGSRLGFNGLLSWTDRRLRPDARWLDLPGDAEVLDDPNWTRLDSGKTRQVYSADFRTVLNNLALEGEVAQQYRGGRAYLLKAYTQYDYLNFTALYRHFDINYNNPYNRGFCEELRFEDTPLEKPYRLVDPCFAALQDFPMPKAEQGFFAEFRYQISRQITFTRVYVDVWRNLAHAADNYRFQGELEYRPVYPLRLRFRQKVQMKEKPKLALGTNSVSLESAVRALVSLSNRDYLTAEVRYGKTILTPMMEYNDEASINGDFLLVQWEHNFSDDFQGEIGIANWRSQGMSSWMFEDNGIDFVDGDGFKWYLALSDRLGDNLLVYLKFRQKLSQFPHTGLGGADGVHYQDGTPARDFVSVSNRFDISLQIDFLW